MATNYTNYLLELQTSLPAPTRSAIVEFTKGALGEGVPALDSIQRIQGRAFAERTQSMLNANPPQTVQEYDGFVNSVEGSRNLYSKLNTYITDGVTELRNGKDTYLANQQAAKQAEQVDFVSSYVWSGVNSGSSGAAATLEAAIRNVPAELRETEQFKAAEEKMRSAIPLVEQMQADKERSSLYANEVKIAENRWGLIMSLSPPTTGAEYDAVFSNVWGDMSEEVKALPSYQFLSSDLIKNKDLYLARIKAGVDQRFLQGQQFAAKASLKSDLEMANPTTLSDADAVVERSAAETPDDIKGIDTTTQAFDTVPEESRELFEEAHNLLNLSSKVFFGLDHKLRAAIGLSMPKEWDKMDRKQKKKAVMELESTLTKAGIPMRTTIPEEEEELYQHYLSSKAKSPIEADENAFAKAGKVGAFNKWVADQGGIETANIMKGLSVSSIENDINTDLLTTVDEMDPDIQVRVARAVQTIRNTVPVTESENIFADQDDTGGIRDELLLHLATNGIEDAALRSHIATIMVPVLQRERKQLVAVAKEAAEIHSYNEVVQARVSHLLESPAQDNAETTKALVGVAQDGGELLGGVSEGLRVASVRAAQTSILDAGFKSMNNSISLRRYIDQYQFGMSEAGMVEALDRYHNLRLQEMNGNSPVLQDQRTVTSDLAQSGTTVTALDDTNTAIARRLGESSGLRFMSTDDANEARILSPTSEWQNIVDEHINFMKLANEDPVLFSRSIGAGVKEMQYFNFEEPLRAQLVQRLRGKDKLQQLFPKENISILSKEENGGFKQVYNSLAAPTRDTIVSSAYEELDNLSSISVDNLRSLFGANDIAAVALNNTMLQKDFISNRAPEGALDKYDSGFVSTALRNMLGGTSYTLSFDYLASIEDVVTLALASQGAVPSGFFKGEEIFSSQRTTAQRNVEHALKKRFDVVSGIGRTKFFVAGGRMEEVMDNVRDQVDSMQFVTMDKGRLIPYQNAAMGLSTTSTPFVWTKIKGAGKKPSKALSDKDYQIRQISADYGLLELRDPTTDIYRPVLDDQANPAIIGFYDKIK